MHGSLSEFTLAQLLQFFALAERSGTITIHARGRESRLIVEGDKIIGWGLEDFDARHGLLNCQLLPTQERESIVAVLPRMGTPGLSFIVRNLVEPQRWEQFAQRQIEQDIYPLLSCEEGEFDIQVMRAPAAPLRLSIPVNSLILDGSRWESEMEAAHLEGYRLETVWKRAERSRPDQDVRMSNLEWMVWATLVAPGSIAEIAERIGAPDLATIGVIRRLQSAQLLAMVS
jgi:hypothetical protein